MISREQRTETERALRSVGTLLSILCLLYSSSASANPWDLYGFNPRALSMGGSHTAMADDFTAVYYNPAGLTMATDPGFGIGFILSRPSLTFDFDRADRQVAELEPPKSDGVTLGALFPLGGARVRNRVAFGIGISVPTSSLLDGQALDPSIPHWYMYQALPRRLVSSIGFGVLPFQWVSLGVGLQFLAGVSGKIKYELDIVAGRLRHKTVTFDIEPSAAPLVGIEFRPIEGLRIGFVYRSSIQSDVDLPMDLQVTGIAELDVQTQFSVQYMPPQFAFGVSYHLAELGLSCSADLTYALWSLTPDPSVASSIDVGGDLFVGTGLDEVFDAPAPGLERRVDLAFRDVLVPRFGVEKELGMFNLRGGYAIRPSPAPLQTSGTNYVDVTTHQFSLGAGIHFHDPLGALANPMNIDVGAALHYAPSRRYEKIDAQDPVGPYDARGVILVVSAAFRYQFGEAAVAPSAPDTNTDTDAEPLPSSELPSLESAPSPQKDPVPDLSESDTLPAGDVETNEQ